MWVALATGRSDLQIFRNTPLLIHYPEFEALRPLFLDENRTILRIWSGNKGLSTWWWDTETLVRCTLRVSASRLAATSPLGLSPWWRRKCLSCEVPLAFRLGGDESACPVRSLWATAKIRTMRSSSSITLAWPSPVPRGRTPRLDPRPAVPCGRHVVRVLPLDLGQGLRVGVVQVDHHERIIRRPDHRPAGPRAMGDPVTVRHTTPPRPGRTRTAQTERRAGGTGALRWSLRFPFGCFFNGASTLALETPTCRRHLIIPGPTRGPTAPAHAGPDPARLWASV